MVGTIALLIGSIVAGLASAGVAAYSANKNYQSQKETNAANVQAVQDANTANAQIAADNRAWQEQMANTAHQREMADLKAAGLNPVLTAMGGSGAISPMPSTAQMQAPQQQAPRLDLNGVSSALNSLTTLALAASIRDQGATARNDARISSNEKIAAQRLQALGSHGLGSYAAVGSANQISRAANTVRSKFGKSFKSDDMSWDDLLKSIGL